MFCKFVNRMVARNWPWCPVHIKLGAGNRLTSRRIGSKSWVTLKGYWWVDLHRQKTFGKRFALKVCRSRLQLSTTLGDRLSEHPKGVVSTHSGVERHWIFVSVFRIVFRLSFIQTPSVFSIRRFVVCGSCPTKRRAFKDPKALIRLPQAELVSVFQSNLFAICYVRRRNWGCRCIIPYVVGNIVFLKAVLSFVVSE